MIFQVQNMKSVKFVLLMAGALISQIAMSQTLEKM